MKEHWRASRGNRGKRLVTTGQAVLYYTFQKAQVKGAIAGERLQSEWGRRGENERYSATHRLKLITANRIWELFQRPRAFLPVNPWAGSERRNYTSKVAKMHHQVKSHLGLIRLLHESFLNEQKVGMTCLQFEQWCSLHSDITAVEVQCILKYKATKKKKSFLWCSAIEGTT